MNTSGVKLEAVQII